MDLHNTLKHRTITIKFKVFDGYKPDRQHFMYNRLKSYLETDI